MNWTAVACGLVKPTFRFIVTDEYQDTNPLTKELVRLAMLPDGRQAMFGQDEQAIYGFRGSISNAMKLCKQEPGAELFTLPDSFRCAKKIVERVNQSLIIPNFRAHGSNIEGEVIDGESVEKMIERAQPGVSAIESRTNAPLMKYCLGFIAKGKPANVEGKDIGKDLAFKIDAIGGNDMPEFIKNLDAWSAAKLAKIGNAWNANERAAQVNDDTETLRTLANACSSPYAMKEYIKELFTDSEDRRKPVIVLTTVHKAKGLEWDEVSILTETFAGNRATTQEQVQEEKNIQHVAWTRAKKRLAFIS